MSSGNRLGTLVVVVLKARHLKDSHTFYKQDAYALVRLGGTGKKTKVDLRGGQHPVWDEELHLPVLDIVPGVDARTLSVAAYSKESKVDELIGEGKVDISATLLKGEFDDWVKLEHNGAYRGEIYLEMTYYSAAPPLARRASKLSSKDRLWRPLPTPPKETTSPYSSPQRSPQVRPSVSSTTNSPHLQPHSSPHLQPSSAYLHPAGSSTSSSSSPRLDGGLLLDASPVGSTTSRQPYIDPTLKNIPFLDVGPPASPAPAPTPAPALYSVPSILRPRNVRSSPIPIPARDDAPSLPPKDDPDDPHRRFQRELAESDAAYAARLAQSEGIDLERLRTEEADAELARRLTVEEHENEKGGGREASIPGGWVS